MHRSLIRAALVAGACLVPALASAQGDVGTAYPGVFGHGRTLAIAGSSVNYMRYTATANRSYYAVCWSHTATDQVVKCDVEWRDGSDAAVGTAVAVEPFQAPFTTYAGDVESYMATTTGSTYLRVANTAVTAQAIDVMVIETTLFSPWWYVLPSAGYDSWVQIRNNSAQSVSVTVRAYDNNGVIAGSSTQAVPANGVILVQVGTLVPVGGAGSMSIAFAGPPGTISANTTTLSGSTGLSFDAPFSPRMVWGVFGYLQS